MSDEVDWPEGLEEETEPPGEEPASEREYAGVVVNVGGAHESDPEDVEPGIEVVTSEFIWAFVDTAQRIAEHPRIARHARDAEFPTPDFTIQMIEDGLGGELAPELKSLYKHSDAYRLGWSYEDADGNERLGGSINLISFTRVFGRWLDDLWIEDEEMDEQERDFVWSLRGFDMPDHPDALQTVLSVDTSAPDSYSLWARDPESGELLQMSLGLIDYLYCALGAFGAPSWQLLFTDYDFELNPWGATHPGTWIARLEDFFPETDTKFFREHLVARENQTAREEE